jgi:prolyl oligopeptidase
VLNVLDNVASRLEEWQRQSGTWQKREVKAPYPGKLSVAGTARPRWPRTTLAEAYC